MLPAKNHFGFKNITQAKNEGIENDIPCKW